MGRPFVLTTVLAALALGGCGGSNKHSSAAGRAGGPAGSASLSTRNISGLGTVLVNGQGETLYAFAPDKGKMVTCTGQCASVWPPLKANGGQKPALSGAVKPSLVSSLPDPSGGRVVTYAGWPLYTYVADAAPGTASGQGLNSSGGAWYVMSPSGTTLKKKFSGSNGPTGYCLAISTRIGTPAGPVQVDEVKPGMTVWSTDRRGQRISVKVLRVHHARVPSVHLMVRLRLADGRSVLVSLGHPLPSGQPVETLVTGQRFEGSRVVSAARVQYGKPYTYDLLPAGPTHTYFANRVLLESTLAPAGG